MIKKEKNSDNWMAGKNLVYSCVSLSLVEPLSRNRSPRNRSYNSRSHCRCLCTSTALCTSPDALGPNGWHSWFIAFFVDTCLCDQPQHTRVHRSWRHPWSLPQRRFVLVATGVWLVCLGLGLGWLFVWGCTTMRINTDRGAVCPCEPESLFDFET